MTNPLQQTKEAIRQPYTFPGGYHKIVIMEDGGTICTTCAKSEFYQIAYSHIHDVQDGWKPAGIYINWEEPDLHCDNCSCHLRPEYGEDNEQN